MADHKDELLDYRGEILAHLLIVNDLNKNQLADILETTPSAVGHWLNGNHGMKIANELTIAYLFGVERVGFYKPGHRPEPRFISSGNSRALKEFARFRDKIMADGYQSAIWGPEEEDWMNRQGIDTKWMRDHDLFKEYPLGWCADVVKEALDRMPEKAEANVYGKRFPPGVENVAPYSVYDLTALEKPTLIRKPLTEEEVEQLRKDLKPGDITAMPQSDYERLEALLLEARSLQTKMGITWVVAGDAGILQASVRFKPKLEGNPTA